MLSSLTPLVWVVLTIVVSVGIALLVRRRFSHEQLRQHNDVAGFIYAVVGVIYAVVLGLVLISVWERTFEAEDLVVHEATILSGMYRAATALDSSSQIKLQTALRDYKNAVVDHEWALLREGEPAPQAREAMHKIYEALHDIEPAGERETVWLNRLIDDVNELAKVRQERVQSSRYALPPLLWAAVLFGGLIIIGFSYLFGTPTAFVASLMVGALAGMIAVTIVAIAALDRPFDGAVRILPDAFEQLDTLFQAWSARTS